MLQSAKEIQGYTIRATDGDIGSVYTFYVDDVEWCMRYVVVDTGNWLPGRRVLVSPTALGQPDTAQHVLPVELTKEQVQNSPDIDTERPVSRQQEILLHAHYNWPAYWVMRDPLVAQALVARPGGAPVPLPPGATPEPGVFYQHGDPHLRSMREVIGYYIEASDGSIGHVEDFIIDTASWHVRYMVVDTRNWLPGKKVLVSPTWIREVNWADSQVHVDLSRDSIQTSPEWDPSSPVQRDYELQLHTHYGRRQYWN